jgi:hypothetical protein
MLEPRAFNQWSLVYRKFGGIERGQATRAYRLNTFNKQLLSPAFAPTGHRRGNPVWRSALPNCPDPFIGPVNPANRSVFSKMIFEPNAI